MKSYPSIRTIGTHLIDSGRKLPFDLSKEDWLGFDKLDGSLIRAEWDFKKGYWKFGRKAGLLDDSNPVLKEAPPLIEEEYAFLDTVFRDFGWIRVVAFFEFRGKNSFAGVHEDEKHTVSLIDLAIPRKGLVDPKDLAIMDVVGGPRVVHRGPITSKDIYRIHEGKAQRVSFEGVVFKRNNRKGIREMFKTKSKAWYEKLKQKCGKNDKLFERLK